METNVNYTIVGAFVIILLSAIFFAIIWLYSGFTFQNYSNYMVYMQESVNGLNIDSPVEYNGVNVGSVNSIKLNPKNPQLVEVLLNIASKTPITRGTVATLNTRGLTGITYVALKDKSTDLRPLVAQTGQPYPIIPSAPSLFMRLDTALGELTKNFKEIADSIHSVLDKENLQSIKEMLLNLKTFTHTLSINSEHFNTIFDNTAKASRQLTPLLQSSATTLKILETQTLPSTYHIISNLDDMSRSLSQFAIELKQNPSILIRGVDRQGLGPGERK